MDMLPPAILGGTVARLAIDPLSSFFITRRNLGSGLLSSLALGAVGNFGLLSGCAYKYIPGYQFTPALFEVTTAKSATTAWLFGSIHAGLSRFYPLPDLVEQKFASSESIAVEIDMSKRLAETSALFRPHVYLPASQSLSTHIGIETFAEMRRYFDWDRKETATHERYAPWYLALIMTSKDDGAAGMERAIGLESVLTQKAAALGKVTLELETPVEQVSAFVSGSMAEQVAQLKARFKQVTQWDRTANNLIEAWRLGDLDQMAALKNEHFANTGEVKALRDRMFAQRDSRIAERLIGLINREPVNSNRNSIFALVGAFHLAGEDSLQEQLVGAGGTVTRVKYA